MATVQISKIQLRRGPASDLPGQPSGIPLVFPSGLDDGELGFTTDTGRLFIGQASPVNGMSNYQRSTFPYQNIEVLTENSPFGDLLAPTIADNQHLFQTAAVLISGSGTVQTYDLSGNPQTFYLDQSGSGTNAVISYFAYDANGQAIRHGRISVLWNADMTTPPLCSDDAEVLSTNATALTWSASVAGSTGNQHVVWNYTNTTGGTVKLFFRIDRPAIA